jgi:histidine triad (HIT) family protein
MAYDRNNIFAKILRGEIPCYKVYEDEQVLAFMDVMPQSDGHTLVIPKYEAENIYQLPADKLQSLIVTTQRIAAAAQQAFKADGITLMQFNGEAAGQTVFHLHFHVVPRYHNVPMAMHARGFADKAVLEKHAEQLKGVLNASISA